MSIAVKQVETIQRRTDRITWNLEAMVNKERLEEFGLFTEKTKKGKWSPGIHL